MKAHIIVTPKPSVFDPQGEAVRRALHGWGLDKLTSVRIGKFIEIEMEPGDIDAYRLLLENASADLLSNPVIENYSLRLDLAANEIQTAGIVNAPNSAFGGAATSTVQRWEGEGGHPTSQPVVPEEDPVLAAQGAKGAKSKGKSVVPITKDKPAKKPKVSGVPTVLVERWEGEGGNAASVIPVLEDGEGKKDKKGKKDKDKKKDKKKNAPSLKAASPSSRSISAKILEVVSPKSWPRSKK